MPHLFKVTAAANVALYRTRARGAVGETRAPSKTHTASSNTTPLLQKKASKNFTVGVTGWEDRRRIRRIVDQSFRGFRVAGKAQKVKIAERVSRKLWNW
jgi:hypothetical protein